MNPEKLSKIDKKLTSKNQRRFGLRIKRIIYLMSVLRNQPKIGLEKLTKNLPKTDLEKSTENRSQKVDH